MEDSGSGGKGRLRAVGSLKLSNAKHDQCAAVQRCGVKFVLSVPSATLQPALRRISKNQPDFKSPVGRKLVWKKKLRKFRQLGQALI